MSKIVQAANAMIAKKEFISDVVSGEGEIFFKYNGKYNWSIKRDQGDTLLWYYPGNREIEELTARSEMHDWEGVEMITYRSSEIGTREAKETFAELFTTVKEKLYRVDEVLDDIIADDPF